MEDVGVGAVAASLESASLHQSPAVLTLPDEYGEMAQWQEVLTEIDEAAEAMTLGDLMHGPEFDLMDAMSSLEIGDPQMDTGMRLAAEAAVEEPPLPTLPETVEAPLLVGLLDEMTCAEHGWYSGLALTQTVYEIEWMQSAPQVAHALLRAALCATARGVAAARSIVLRADVHEEEDFTGSVNGLKLHDDVGDADLVAMLTEAEEQCAAELREAKAKAALLEAAASGEDGGEAAADAAAEAAAMMTVKSPGDASALATAVTHAEAVLCRMRFRRGFCGALLSLARPSPKMVEQARKMLTFAESQLVEVERTMHVGVPREEMAWCLSGRAVKKALGSAPTKKIQLATREESIAKSRALIAELRALAVLSSGECDVYDGFSRWLDDLSSVRPGSNVLSRSTVQLVAVSEDRGGAGMRPPIVTMLGPAVAAFSGMSDALARELYSLEPVAEFMSQLATGELSRLRLQNINRGRQRRRLRHYLSDWGPLQGMAEQLDGELQQAGYLAPGFGPFSSWTLHRTLRDMIRFIALGFEIELYAECEYEFMYWYEDLICGMRLQLHQDVADKANQHAMLLHQEQQAAATAAAATGGKKGKKAAKAVKPFKPLAVGTPALHVELLFTRVHLDLSRGTRLLLSCLLRLGFMPKYDSEFMPLARRFEQRFLPFAELRRPPLFASQHFTKACAQLNVTNITDLLMSSMSNFKNAKARLDGPLKLERGEGAFTPFQRAEAMALVKVAVANSVLIASLMARPPPEGSRAKFAFAAHAHFVTVTMAPPPAPAAAPAEPAKK